MNLQGILNIAMAIVIVAGITSVVMRPNSIGIINAIGSTFRNSLATAMGS